MTDINTVSSPYKFFKPNKGLKVIKHYSNQKFEVQVLVDAEGMYSLEYCRIGQEPHRSGPTSNFYTMSFAFDDSIVTLGGN